MLDYNGANLLMAGDGSDLIRSGPGNDTMDGGSGPDEVSYAFDIANGSFSDHCHAITADLSQGTASGTGFGLDVLGEIEMISSGGGSDVLIGDDGPNSFSTGYPCFASPRPLSR